MNGKTEDEDMLYELTVGEAQRTSRLLNAQFSFFVGFSVFYSLLLWFCAVNGIEFLAARILKSRLLVMEYEKTSAESCQPFHLWNLKDKAMDVCIFEITILKRSDKHNAISKLQRSTEA